MSPIITDPLGNPIDPSSWDWDPQTDLSERQAWQQEIAQSGGVRQAEPMQAGIGGLVPVLAAIAGPLVKFAGKALAPIISKLGIGGTVAAGVGALAAIVPSVMAGQSLLSGRGFDIGRPGPGLFDVGTPGPGVFGSSIPGLRAGEQPVKQWWTGTARFYKTNLGRLIAERKDGSFKIYRPARHIVISRNPRVGTLLRADARLNRLVSGLSIVKTRRSAKYYSKRSKKR